MAPRVKKQQDTESRSASLTAKLSAPQSPHMVILGAGYTARALMPPLIERGFRVTATRRKLGGEWPSGVKALVFDGAASPELRAALSSATHLLSAVGPGRSGDPVLTALPDLGAAAPHLHWAGYLSATSVYGHRAGQWAFEDEPPKPMTARGRRRAEAELNWIETGLPVHIFRLAGIYGPRLYGQSRSPFDKLRAGTARAVIKPGHVVNRIHVEDIARALLASMDAPHPQRIYNIADGNPCPPQNVLDHAAALIDVPAPPRISLDDESVSDMAKSFYSETKRIDITRAKEELAWKPLYADYKIGLKAILDRS